MKNNMNEPNSAIKEISEYKKEYRVINSSHPSRCIDDRKLKVFNITLPRELKDVVISPENFDGPQLLGGAIGLYFIAAETAPENIDLTFSKMFSVTKKAYEKTGMVMGVHTDDLHGEMSEEDLKVMLIKLIDIINDLELGGCGAAKLASSEDNPFGFSERVHQFAMTEKNLIVRFVRGGAKLSILEGHHAEKTNAVALQNLQQNLTYFTNDAVDNDKQAYNHDQKELEKLVNALAEVVGGENKEWEENVKAKGLNLNEKWLKVATNILAGMDPIIVE
jgi:hypothetical protein